MARLRKGVFMFREIPNEGEKWSPKSDNGQPIGYRHVLIDWLNDALQGNSADREAAERVGALIHRMNDSTVNYLKTLRRSLARMSVIEGADPALDDSDPGADDASRCEAFLEIASSYKVEFDMLPGVDGKRWTLICRCVEAPSGAVYGGEPYSAPQLRARWEGQDSICNPEGMAVDAVIQIALDGQLGTIKQCGCRQWFLTKDDPRVRWCSDHDVDDFRAGTDERRLQVNAAAKAARDRVRDKENKYWARVEREEGLPRPGVHRAEK